MGGALAEEQASLVKEMEERQSRRKEVEKEAAKEARLMRFTRHVVEDGEVETVKEQEKVKELETAKELEKAKELETAKELEKAKELETVKGLEEEWEELEELGVSRSTPTSVANRLLGAGKEQVKEQQVKEPQVKEPQVKEPQVKRLEHGKEPVPEQEQEKEVYSSSAAGFVHSGRREQGERVEVEEGGRGLEREEDWGELELYEDGGGSQEGGLTEAELLALQVWLHCTVHTEHCRSIPCVLHKLPVICNM